MSHTCAVEANSSGVHSDKQGLNLQLVLQVVSTAKQLEMPGLFIHSTPAEALQSQGNLSSDEFIVYPHRPSPTQYSAQAGRIILQCCNKSPCFSATKTILKFNLLKSP